MRYAFPATPRCDRYEDPADPGVNRVLAAAADALDGGKPAVLEPVGAGRTIGGRQSEHAARHRPSGPTAAVRAAATAPLGRFAKGAGARSRSQMLPSRSPAPAHCRTSRFPTRDIWDPLAHIFDALTFDRCMWGTDARGQIADLQRGGRGVPRYRPAVRRRPRQADGRHGEPHLRVVAVKGLSADPEGIVAAPTFGGRGSSPRLREEAPPLVRGYRFAGRPASGSAEIDAPSEVVASSGNDRFFHDLGRKRLRTRCPHRDPLSLAVNPVEIGKCVPQASPLRA